MPPQPRRDRLSPFRPLPGLVLVLLGVLGGFFLHGRKPAAKPGPAAATEAEPAPAADREPSAEPRPPPAPKKLDAAQREQLRALIWQAIGHPEPAEEPPPKRGAPYVFPENPPWARPHAVDDPDDRPGKIDPKYIQERVRNDFFPLARQCYSDGLEKDPALAGEVRFAFNIVGDAKTGGIVESVDVLNASTLRDPDVIECMRQSFLSVSFPPPEGGGEVTVIYPIIFSNEDGG